MAPEYRASVPAGLFLLLFLLLSGARGEPLPAQTNHHHHHRAPSQQHHSRNPTSWLPRHNAQYNPHHTRHNHNREAATQTTTTTTTTEREVDLYPRFQGVPQPGRRVCWSGSETSGSSASSSGFNYRQPRLHSFGDQQQQQQQAVGLVCCPGWTQVTRLSFGCNKPLCSVACQNGGVCSSPNRCACPRGFTGSYCQTDIDECVSEKPCDQICINTAGSYECYCRSGYNLQADRQSCRRNVTEDDDVVALEARDLIGDFGKDSTTRRPLLRDTENDVNETEEEGSYEALLRRLEKMEKVLAKSKKRDAEAGEIVTKIAAAINSIDEIRRSVQDMHLMQQEIYELRNKVKLYEYESRKIQHLSNKVVDLENILRLRCRSNMYFRK
ncbi:uncharacterized protein LOC106648474 isoform X3 [Trichogramma pretiosum]|uniref:uncharacterized protein LOC106648474 isoform X3 n=1 Tax=Trichogramma pretiosum TaxID=7493 RepID=UPI000C71A071|nr:uncharacterized protein LOC106648474 isoform X3 [Trichogramma pretiosum]